MYGPADLNVKISDIARKVKGQSGLNRIQAGLRALKENGLVDNIRDQSQVQGAMAMLPGPFGRGNPNNELPAFLDYCAQYADDFDPTGLPGGRYTGLGFGSDPRNDDEKGREDCDLFGVIAGDVAAGSTGANVTLTNASLDTEYDKAVLWLWTDAGKIRNIVSITVDGRPFFLGPSASIPADIADITLEPHPRRQGIYLGRVTRSLVVTAFCVTSASAVHWEVTLDAAVSNLATQRPGGRVLHRGRFSA